MSTVPQCKKCGQDMIPRANPTPMAAEQGAWFDHPLMQQGHSLIGHWSAVLIPAEEVAR